MKKRTPITDLASKGGKARRDALTPERRSEIARRAVEARWERQGRAPVPVATHGSPDRPLRIGDLEIPCYVLSDQRRVIVQRGMMTAIKMSQGTAGRGGGDRLAKFISTKALKDWISPELSAVIKEPIRFRTHGGNIAYGYEATVLADLCAAVLEAREKGKLHYQQVNIAKQCEILVRSFAKVGIIALVDEATGYQDDRARDALAKILERFVAKELRKWLRTFPLSFFKEICRLKGIPFREDMKLPRWVGHIVNDLVWDRLAPGLREKLNEKNPVTETGRRKHKNFQWLTEEVGNPALLYHLGMIEGLAKGYGDGEYDKFHQHVDLALPRYPRFKTLFSDAPDQPTPHAEQD